jgi:hypothetical protein
MWVPHLAFSVGDAFSNAPISIESSWHRTARSADANRGFPRNVLWMARWRREGMDRRFGRVVVIVDAGGEGLPSSGSGSVVVHDRVWLGEGVVWCGGLCHVAMGYGKARAMREMERDFRLGMARAMPTTVDSPLIF